MNEIPEEKQCKDCKLIFPITSYKFSNPGKRRGNCIDCYHKKQNANKKIYWAKNKESISKSEKERRLNNLDHSKKLDKESRMRRRDKIYSKNRIYEYKKKFGITIEEYNSMLIIQNNACMICGHRPKESDRLLAVDHCHITGTIRGLLCFMCNTGIGAFYDDYRILIFAKQYLDDSRFLQYHKFERYDGWQQDLKNNVFLSSEEIKKNIKLVHNYNISLETFNEIEKVQNNKCAICKTHKDNIIYNNSKRNYKLYIDHDHKTNIIRGLLCHFCNVGLGLLNDSIPVIDSAILYLKKHNTEAA